MSHTPDYGKWLARASLIASLTALAIVLRFFEIPVPYIGFIKFDFSGVPLVVLALARLSYGLAALPAYYIVSVLLGADPVGMAMKVAAEVSTFIPVALLFGRLGQGRRATAISASLAAASRTVLMALLNLVVSPHWILWAKLASTYEEALSITLALLPGICVFNAFAGAVVAPIGIYVYRVVKSFI